MPGGRPSTYDPSLGNKLIELMDQGYSITASAGQLGYHRQRFHEWEKQHPEFSDAIKTGRGKRLFKLETDLLAAEDGPKVTSRIFALKNADGDEWREKQEVSGELTINVIKRAVS